MFFPQSSWPNRSSVAVALLVLASSTMLGARAQSLAGPIDSSSRWGSGWMDLAPPVDFQKGEKLKVQVGGTAKKVLVRLLPASASADSEAGVLGGAMDVPETRMLEVPLAQPHKQIKQISVHGGPNPWGKFPLGGGNGSATIVSVERVKP